MAVHPIRARRSDEPGQVFAPGERRGVVLPFRQAARAVNLFSWRDRIELLEWAAEARAIGICRMSVERADPDDHVQAVGDFALMYDGHSEWACWAVAREGDGYLAWSPNSGESAGSHPTLTAALESIRNSAR